MLYLVFRCLRLARHFENSDEVDDVESSENSDLEEELLELEGERRLLLFFLAFDLKKKAEKMYYGRTCQNVI